MKGLGIRQYVAWLTTIPLFIMAIGMGIFFLHDRFDDMDRDMLENGSLIISQLASSSEYGVFSNNRELLLNIATNALHQVDVQGVAILDANASLLATAGEFSADFKSSVLERHKSAELIFPASGHIGDVIVLQPSASDARNLWLYHAIVPTQIALDDVAGKSAIKPTGSVVMEISTARHGGHKTRMFWITFLSTTLFLALTVYLVQIASRRITHPIQELSDAVQSIGAGSLDTRVSITTGVAELATLAKGLNNTTEQLQQEQITLQWRIDEATAALREKKEEAERASHDKSRFLAVASHDLRQPLHALGLYIAELQRKLSGTEHQRLTEQVEQSVEALSTLLNALLDISKLDAGAIVPQIRACSVDTILKRIAADYQMVANVKNIRLIVRPCIGFVASDSVLLERILGNLVSNAIRYTYQNGTVMLGCRRRGQFMRIEVRDSGVGISQADQMNIYREFFQLAQPELDTSKGLGLGLAIVDRLAKLLGHRMYLRSAPGKGSVFAVEVRIAQQADKVASSFVLEDSVSGEEAISPLIGKKLLIVEDDPAVLAGTARIMTSWGCQADTAASVADVVQLMRDGKRWDFIVSDYQLGGKMTGIDVIELICQQQNQHIPCVLISGDTSPAALKLVSVSGYHLLHKPVKPAKLRSLIEHLLEQEARKS